MNKIEIGNININNFLTKRQNGLLDTDKFRANLFTKRLSVAKNLYKNDIVCHYGCVNAIEFSKEGKYLISGGDDRRVLHFKVDEALVNPGSVTPVAMQKQHDSNIFALSFDNKNTKIFSGGNDDTCIVHDIELGEPIDVFIHQKPVYGVSVDPVHDDIFATAGEDGRVLIFDLRASSEVMSLAKYRTAFHAAAYHPFDGNLMVTANAKEGAALWDLRRPRIPTLRYGGDNCVESCMSVRFNNLGTQVLGLRRRLPPVLYTTASTEPVCQFYHVYYYNSCTMKSCTFAGEFDEYVLSGSDDFNLYVWKVPDTEKGNQWIDDVQMVLYGHRSIVNQVRYNPQRCVIASSGVEKVIKLWTPFALDGWKGELMEESQGPENAREVFTHEQYMSMVQINGQNMTHDYSNQNTNEDPRMMAFFDYLVQQEIEGWDDTLSQTSEDSSNENSSHADSESSDSETYKATKLTGKTTTAVQQRTRYRNRIAYLIATKRNKLKRLALRGTNKTSRRTITKTKYRANNKRTERSHRSNRKAVSKRLRKSLKRPAPKDQTSDSEVPKSFKKRRLNSTGPTSYRSFRRKVKTPLSSTSNTSTRAADKSQTSTSSSSGETDTERTKLPLPVRPEIVRKPPPLDTPSTSTGITANGKGIMFRINRIHDSDDSLSDLENGNRNHLGTNGIHLNPTTNGIHHRLSDTDSHHHYGLDLDTDGPDHCNNSSMNEYVCSSPSNSRLSSFQEEEDDDDDEDDDDEEDDDESSLLSEDDGLDVESETENAMTPIRNVKTAPVPERDSGTASASNSMLKNSGNERRLNLVNGPKTIDADELLRKLNKVKKNYRVKFEESDSD